MTDAPLCPELLPLGQDGVLIRFARTPDARAMAAAQTLLARLRNSPPDGITELAPSLGSVLLRFDPEKTSRARLHAALNPRLEASDWGAAALPPPRRRWHVPMAFGGDAGPQLAEVAALLGQSPEQTMAQACATELRVLTIGFTPGMPYLGLLPPAWDIPRQSQLTPQVPAGALATAVRQMVLFPKASTTGWRQIGRTAFRPFLPDRAQPILLEPGDALRLEPVDAETLRQLETAQDAGLGGARCTVLA